jgi:hypothetical protein
MFINCINRKCLNNTVDALHCSVLKQKLLIIYKVFDNAFTPCNILANPIGFE